MTPCGNTNKAGILGIPPVLVLVTGLFIDPSDFYRLARLDRGHISTLPICIQGGGHTDKRWDSGDAPVLVLV